MKPFDIVLRFVPNYGWFPIIKDISGGGDIEIFRGSYKKTPEEAMTDAIKYLPGYNLSY
jgi:hypothetical protein